MIKHPHDKGRYSKERTLDVQEKYIIVCLNVKGVDRMNDGNKLFFNFELPNGDTIEEVWFSKKLKAIYGNEPFDDIIGYSSNITCFDRNEKEVDYNFIYGAQVTKVYILRDIESDITEHWKRRMLNFLKERKILGLRENWGQTMLDPYVSETIKEER